ncbi:sugar transferase [Marinilabilia rubra]|nr:sugar transferase [Marinilabilia rubra]
MKKKKKTTVFLLFFKTPSKIILERIEEYLESLNCSNYGYFGKEELPESFARLGGTTDFHTEILKNPPSQILIVGSPERNEISQELLVSLRLSRATIKLVPVKFDLFSSLIQVNKSNDLPHIRLLSNHKSLIDKSLKTIFNYAIALAGIFITTLVFPFMAIFIKATSKGPIFYKQKRLGLYAKPFYLYKFRTMYLSAEARGPQLSSDSDKRITTAGKILRYWHMDELPQFWNILKGDMALVGPRPERPHFAELLTNKIPYYKIIYQEKPGLTSLGMIKYGYASSVTEMTDRLYYDIVYLNNPTFLMDLKILANTVRYIFLKTFYDPSPKRKIKREAQIKTLTNSNEPLIRWLTLKSKINS